MMAWVLLWAWGFNHAMAISGIASKEACEDLGKRMQSAYTMGAPTYYCYQYPLAR